MLRPDGVVAREDVRSAAVVVKIRGTEVVRIGADDDGAAKNRDGVFAKSIARAAIGRFDLLLFGPIAICIAREDVGCAGPGGTRLYSARTRLYSARTRLHSARTHLYPARTGPR